LTLTQALFLFFAGAAGGALNSVAGGGSFIGFPALLFTGVPAIPANATNTLALWCGTTASTRAYRDRLTVAHRVLLPLIVTSVIGGVAGAFLLLRTPQHTFLQIVPWLMLAATLLFALAPWFAGRRSSLAHDASTTAIAGASLFELFAALYGGYFGGGLGIMNLAMLAAIGMTDIHEMNGMKALLGSIVNGVAVLTFILAGAVYWRQAGVMVAGALIGGYFGAHYAQKLPQKLVRGVVIATGAVMTVYFFLRKA
jgi:uncharacterized protein